MEYKFPNLENFVTSEVVELINDFKGFVSNENYFFLFNNIPITIKEMNLLIEKKQYSSSAWIFLLNYLTIISETQENRELPFFQFYVIHHFDYEKNDIKMSNETDSIVQTVNDESHNKQVILVKFIKKYFLILLYHDLIYIIDYCQINKETMKIITRQILEDHDSEIRLIQNYINNDSSQFYFYFIYQFIQGQKIDSIQLSEYDDKFCQDRVIWLILTFGFDHIENDFQQQLEIENQEILKFKQQEALKEVRKQRVNLLQPKKLDKLRLLTPKTKKEREDEIKILNERVSYLKVLNGAGDEDDILSSMMFQMRLKKQNKQVEDEFKNLDLLKQTQLLYQSSQNQLVKNASQILQGKFSSQLFSGLGLNPNSKEDALKSLQEKNYQSILEPIMNKEQKKLPPGEFVRTNKENIIAMKYGIKISRDALQELRYDKVRTTIVDFYFKFLQEYSTFCNERQAFMRIEDFDNLLFEQRTGKEAPNQQQINYLKDFDYIYFPIKQGDVEEYSLGVINVNDLTLKHYYLCSQRSKLPVNQLQQIFRSWQAYDYELIDEVQHRIDQQHRFLQLIIYWIRKQANLFGLEKISNMKLWKIRIEDIQTVKSPPESGMYLLSVATNFCLKRQKIDTPKNKDIIREIIENIICVTGFQQKLVNLAAINYFQKRIQEI